MFESQSVLERINRCEKEAVELCLEKDVISYFKDSFELARNLNIDWGTSKKNRNVENVAQMLIYLAGNVNKRIEAEIEKEFVRQIIVQINDLLLQIQNESESEQKKGSLTRKINCLSEFLNKNRVGYQTIEGSKHQKIFESFRKIFYIFQIINSNWRDLEERGLSTNFIHLYWETFYNEIKKGIQKNEKARYKEFIALLNGEMILKPSYIMKVDGYRIMPADSLNYELILRIQSDNDKVISLLPKKLI